MKSLNLRITIRVETKQRKQIDQALSEGKCKSASDLIRMALTDFLKSKYQKRKTKAQLETKIQYHPADSQGRGSID